MCDRSHFPMLARSVHFAAVFLLLLATSLLPADLPSDASAQSEKSVVWDQIDVTVELRTDGTLEVSERDRIDFRGGPFQKAHRDLHLVWADRYDDVRVGEVIGDRVEPYAYVVPDQFTIDVPNTYTAERIGAYLRISWSFPETTSRSRTFALNYDAVGALGTYDQTDRPFQQLNWTAVSQELTESAPVNEATLTIILPRAVDPGEVFIAMIGPDIDQPDQPEQHTQDGRVWTWTARDLGAGDALKGSFRFPPVVDPREPEDQEVSERAEQEAATPGPAATSLPRSVATPLASSRPDDAAGPTPTHAVATPEASPVAVAPLPQCRTVVQTDLESQTLRLLADCTTDRPLAVPDGWTFDGGDHVVFAVDPPGARLIRGVVSVTGATGTVRDVTIDGSRLADTCFVDDGVSALAGILFDGAAGAVSGVRVRNLERALPDSAEKALSARISCGTGIAVFRGDEAVSVTDTEIGTVGGAGIWIEAAPASISRTAIDRAAGVGVVAVSGAHVRLSPENQITNGRVGILFEGAGTNGRIAGNMIDRMTEAGIVVLSDAQVSIAGNTVRRCGLAGISVEGAASTATIVGNRLDDPSEVGIKVLGSRAEIRNNTVTGTFLGIGVFGGVAEVDGNAVAGAAVGIAIGNGATAELRENVLRLPSDTGIFVIHNGTTATIDSNTVEGAGDTGIGVDQGARATATANTVTDARSTGIYADNGAQVAIIGANSVHGGDRGILVSGASTTGTIVGNSLDGADIGIAIKNRATADVSQNTITDAGVTGLVVDGGASAESRDNTITGGSRGIVVAGQGTSATFSDNRVKETSTAGVILQSGSQTTLTEIVLLRPGIDGIRIEGQGTTATVTDITVSESTRNGIAINDGASGEIAGSEVTGGVWAILVDDSGTSATVTANSVRDFTDGGIKVDTGAAAKITGNEVDGGKWGIAAIGDGTTVTISGNTIAKAEHQGVVVHSGANVTIADNTVSGGDSGIYVRGTGTHATISGNTVSDSISHGVWVWDGAVAEQIDNNFISGGHSGITIERPGTRALISENQIAGTTHDGILIGFGVSATVANNTITEVGTSASGVGISVEGPATTATLNANTIAQVTGIGILFGDRAAGSVTKNTVTDAQFTGIRISNPAGPMTLDGNIVRDAGMTGIEVWARDVVVTNNLVEGSRQVGIQLGPDGTVMVSGNTVHGPAEPVAERSGPLGIKVFHGVGGTIEGNRIAGHRNADPEFIGCGIMIDVSARNIEVRDNLFPAPGNEANVCDARSRTSSAPGTPVATPLPHSRSLATPVG